MIFNYILDYIYSKFNELLSSWNQDILQPNGTNWQNCFGSVDETVLRIFRSKINQNIVCNGHKQAHGIMFESLPLTNGLIGNLSSPYVGTRDDSTMSHVYRRLSNLQRSVLA